MTKSSKLKICDWMLVFITVLSIASSLQLEITGSQSVGYVWLHIILCCLFFANIVWHLYLHFGWNGWNRRLMKQKSTITRWLAIMAMLTLISAVVTVFHWIGSQSHSYIGAVHGKLGFIFIILAIIHTVKRINFYKLK